MFTTMPNEFSVFGDRLVDARGHGAFQEAGVGGDDRLLILFRQPDETDAGRLFQFKEADAWGMFVAAMKTSMWPSFIKARPTRYSST